MNKLLYCSLTFAIFHLACGQPEVASFKIEDLDSMEKRKAFLDSILETDQKVRTDAMTAEKLFGYYSEESNTANHKMWKVDSSNLEVVQQYLEAFDYPDEETYGNDANTSLWMVIHHAPSGYDIDYRGRAMPYLVKAWKDGALSDKAFSFFLNRYYRESFGETFTFEGSMKTNKEVKVLLEKLGYKKNIINGFNR